MGTNKAENINLKIGGEDPYASARGSRSSFSWVKLIVHISEGRKTMSLGVLFGTYVMKENVHSVFYIMEETNAPLQLPIIKLRLPSKKMDVLKAIARGKKKTEVLAKSLKITSATLYVHLKELRDEGFISGGNELTEIGRIVLLEC